MQRWDVRLETINKIHGQPKGTFPRIFGFRGVFRASTPTARETKAKPNK